VSSRASAGRRTARSPANGTSRSGSVPVARRTRNPSRRPSAQRSSAVLRYGAGQCVTYEDASDPTLLAEMIAKTVREEVHYRPVETGGAARAADMLAELI
jgi:hypothetical protein